MRLVVPLVACAVLATATATVLRAQPATTPDGFDHNIHARNVDVAALPPLPCTSCHPIQRGLLVGRPGHAACFGACHGAAPDKGKPGAKIDPGPDRVEICAACHTRSSLGAPFARTRGKPSVTVAYPPYAPSDFAVALGHKRHGQVACAQCHDLGKRAKPAVHRRCLGCHDGSTTAGRGPAMTACTGCHEPGTGRPLPPAFAEPVDTVTATFSHARHASRGRDGAACTTCHANIAATDESILPRPQASSCAIQGCHVGTPAFAITAACTRR